MKKKKVAVAMSGGVDSGVAAALLVKEGYQCAGFHMELWSERKEKGFRNKCCDFESSRAALRTAHKLKIPFYTIDLKDIFKGKVVDYFLESYACGLTPNPCIKCNKLIKFGALLDYVKKKGYDYLATGHYVKVKKDKNGYQLLAGVDKTKDQSYFLYNFNQRQLPYLLFPLGKYKKKDVIYMAKKMDLPVANRPESQEICFFSENDYRPFLKRNLDKEIKSGEVVNVKGKVIGFHSGIPLYTVGQRHGFTVNKGQASNLSPFYVIEKKMKTNQLVVGFGKETERKEFLLKDINWINIVKFKGKGFKTKLKVRYQGELLKAKVLRQDEKGKWLVILDEAERGISSGQSVVFYEKDEVLGGGIIDIDKMGKKCLNVSSMI